MIPVAHESLQRAWAEGRPAVGGWVSRAPDFVIDMFRRAGYDFIGIDCQHTAADESAVAALLTGLAPGGPPAFVRVSKNDPALIGLMADAGADGVIVPAVNSADEARAAVAAVRYPPHGIRSYGPMRTDLPVGDLTALADRVSVFVMIETSEGLGRVGEITGVPGVAGVYVGPADLSIALGMDPGLAFSSDQLADAVERIRRACANAGIIVGMHQTTAADAVRWAVRGVQLMSISDRFLLYGAVQEALRTARSATLAPQARPGPKPDVGA